MNLTTYDFQKPGPLAGDQERQLHRWIEAACALVERVWGENLSFAAKLRSSQIAGATATEALAGLPQKAYTYPLHLNPQWCTLLIWPRSLALSMVAGLLGDDGELQAEERDLTVVEESLFEFFLKDLLLTPFWKAWSGQEPLTPVLQPAEPNPRWARLFPADQSMIAANFEITGPFGTGTWCWLMPKEALARSLGADRQAKEEANVVRQRLEGAVRELPVELTITLGVAELSITQLSQLQVGDLLLLEQRIAQPLRGRIAGVRKVNGWPGRIGARQAFQIEHIDDQP